MLKGSFPQGYVHTVTIVKNKGEIQNQVPKKLP